MKTIDELITELVKLKSELGGNTEVLFSFNGCTNSGELLRITEVTTTGFFTDPNDNNGDIYQLDEYEPNPGDLIKKYVHLRSDRDPFVNGEGIDFRS